MAGSEHLSHARKTPSGRNLMLKLVAWLLLFAVSWPLALVALVVWALVWLLSLPFRLVGTSLDAVFDLIESILHLPARLLGGSLRSPTNERLRS
jgi:hypothetical protein